MSIRNWLFVVGLLAAGSAAAQTAPSVAAAPAVQPPSQTPAPDLPPGAEAKPAARADVVDCPPKTSLQGVAVLAVAVLPREPSDQAASPKGAVTPAQSTVELRQGISVTVSNLNRLLEYAHCANKNVVLFLNKRQMTDLTPNPKSDPDQNTLFFELKRTEESRDVWTSLLGKPRFTPRRVEVSVGLVDGYAMPGAGGPARTVMLDVVPGGWLAIWAAVILFLLFCGLRLGSKSDMLRDSGPPPGKDATGREIRKSFSLARVQLATWTFLILSSYLFIGLITGDYTTSITDSVLALMGISAGTAIGSSLIDNNPSRLPAGSTAVAVAALPQGTVVAPAAGIPGQPNVVQPGIAGPAAAPAASTATAPAPVAVVVRPAPATTGRWWRDILMDEEGVNFHRFQMAAWTFVLGIVFLRQVYNELAMPEFNPALLALIGISSGTYLGLKITAEKPSVA